MLRPYQRLCLAACYPPPRDPNDVLNELVVGVAGDPSGLREAGVHRRIGDDARQGIELDDVRDAEAVNPHVDAAPVAAPQRAIRIERHALRLAAQRLGHTRRRALEDRERMLARVPDPLRFVAVYGRRAGGQRTSPLLPRIATVNSGPGRYVSTSTACW